MKTKKVLLIEDEGDMCLLMNIMLSGKGINLEHVKSIAAAEAFLTEEQPSAIVLDNRLPDGFGVDFISIIKKKYPTVKIGMVSGFSSTVKDVALESGADFFLEKPFTKDQLFASVKSLLN